MAIQRLPLVPKNVACGSDWYTLIALGDIHFGHTAVDEEGFLKMIGWIRGHSPTNLGVVLTGDLIENVIPGSKGNMFEMKYPNPEEQIERVLAMLKPISPFVLMMVDGNHEDRAQRVAGMAVSRRMARELGVPYAGYHGALDLKLKHGRGNFIPYLTYVEHGCGAIPKQMSGRYNRLESIQSMVDADIYIKGHIHHKLAFAKRVWRKIGGRMVKRKCMFASNGSYLADAEYAIRMGYEPTEPGVAKLMISSEEFNIHCSI